MLAEEGAAIEVVYARHYARLERQLTSITRDADDGQELAAEAFARFSREIAAGRTPHNPGAWLRRVGANLAWSRGRHISVVGRRLTELASPAACEGPEAIVIRAETWRALSDALDELPSGQRQAVALAAHGYDAAEIGRALGRTPGAIRTILCRGRRKLRHRLEAAGLMLGSSWISIALEEFLHSMTSLSPS